MKSLEKDIKMIKGILITILTLVFFSFWNGCSNTNKIKSITYEINNTTNQLNKYIDSTFYSKQETDIIIDIEGYKISKRMLYDNNAIVRTKIRPDDQMNQYDSEIEKLQKKLKQIRRNNNE
jgi:hypothetical protein